MDELDLKVDIPLELMPQRTKRNIVMPAVRCIVCSKWEAPKFNTDLYNVTVEGETYGVCESCRKAILWAKENMEEDKSK